MTVAELIERLRTMPQDARVMVDTIHTPVGQGPIDVRQVCTAGFLRETGDRVVEIFGMDPPEGYKPAK